MNPLRRSSIGRISSLFIISAAALSLNLSPDLFAKGSSSFGGSRSSSSFGGSRSSSSFGGSKSSSFGGGSKSWGGSSGSSSKPSAPSSGSSSFGGSKPSAPAAAPSSSSSWFGGSKTPVAPPPTKANSVSKTDAALANKVSMSGSQVKVSREQAVADFKAKNAAKFPTTFKSEPATRPTYIPQSYTDRSGSYRPIYYDRTRGGYGYWDTIGTFILWDALTDQANNHATQVIVQQQAAPTAGTVTTTTTRTTNESSNAGTAILTFLVVLGIAGGTLWYLNRNSGYSH